MRIEPGVYVIIGILIVFLLTWLFSKKTIAFWIYFNTLVLVAYLPMLDIFMPSNVFLFMKPFMDVVRLKLPAFELEMIDFQDDNRK